MKKKPLLSLPWRPNAGSLLAALLLCGLLTASPANNIVQVVKEGYRVGWPAGVGSGSFKGGVMAMMSADELPDAFLLRGSTLVLMPECGVQNSFREVAQDVADVCAMVGAGGGGTKDLVAIAGPGGVHTLEFLNGTLISRVVDAGYTGGVQIRSADVDGAPGDELVVLDADGVHFRIYKKSMNWMLIETLDFEGTSVSDFDLARLDVNAGHDLVLATTDGVEAYRLTFPGAELILWRNAAYYTNNQVEALPDHVSPGVDGFVWGTRVDGIDRWGLTAGHGGGIQSSYLLDAGTEIVGLEAITMAPGVDPLPDLVVSLADASLLIVFENQGPGGLAFSNAAAYSMTTTFSGTNGFAVPVLGDTDGSGIADVLIGNDAAMDMQIIYSADPVAYPAEGASGGSFGWSDLGSAQDAWAVRINGTDLAEAHVAVYSSTPLIGGEPPKIRVDVFRQEQFMEPVQNAGVSLCTDPGTFSIGGGGMDFELGIGVAPTGAIPGNCIVMRLRPDKNIGEGRPVLLLGVGVRRENDPSPLVGNDYLTLPLGVTEDDIRCMYRLNLIPQGVGITVERLPLRRITPPPGTDLTPASMTTQGVNESSQGSGAACGGSSGEQ